jgi:hypothetical protein
MSFKPFYIHENRGPGKLTGRSPRGFTLKVSPDPDNQRNVVVQGAWCSHKDEFVKKTGRLTADVAESKSINKRELPNLLSSMQNTLHPFSTVPGMYNYVLKYVV